VSVRIVTEPRNPTENFENKLVDSKKKKTNENKGNTTQIGKLCRGEYYLGIRLNTLLYTNKQFRNSLGLFIESDLNLADAGISKKLIPVYSSAAALGIVSSVYVIFVAKEEGHIYLTWGKRYKTYIVFSAQKQLDELAQLLYGTEFQIGPDSIPYTIEKNSIRIKKE
jgi:hypothetical protein